MGTFFVRVMGNARGDSLTQVTEEMDRALAQYPQFKLTEQSIDMWADGLDGKPRLFDGKLQFTIIIGGTTEGASFVEVQRKVIRELGRYAAFESKSVTVNAVVEPVPSIFVQEAK